MGPAAGFCPTGDPRSSSDSNSIKVPFICRGGLSNRLGGFEGGTESFEVCSTAQRSHLYWVLHGFTICGAPPHPPPPPVHTCSCLQQMFEVTPPPSTSSSSSHKPKKKNKKRHTKASPGCPQDSQARRVGGRKNRGGEGGGNVCVCLGGGGRLKNIYFIPAQVSFPSPPDVTLTHVKQQEEGGKRLKLENLIYLIISQNN